MIRTVLDKSEYPRILLVKRLHLLHYIRLRKNTYHLPFTSIVQALTQDLVMLSVSHYSQVRMESQEALSKVMVSYPTAKYKTLPRVFKYLEKESKRNPYLPNFFILTMAAYR